MAGRGEVRYRITADSSGLQSAAASGAKSLERLGASAVKMAGTFVSIRAAVNLVTGALKAQAEQERSINALNLALANQGRLSEATTKSLLAQATALQRMTAFTDDAVIAGQALLASFGMNEEQIRRTMSAALDFSAATGKDLSSAVEVLGKAFAGNTGQLSRYGIVLDDSLPKAAKFNAALSQLEGRFSGSAVAATKTYTGGMEQLKNAFGEAEEGFGKFLGTLSGSAAPFGVAIQAAEWLTRVLGQDLILALGEARAQFDLMIAGFLRSMEKWGKGVASLPGMKALEKLFGVGVLGPGLAEMSQGAGDMAGAFEASAEQWRESSNLAATSAGNLQQYANVAGGAVSKVEKLTEAQKKLNAEFAGPLASQIVVPAVLQQHDLAQSFKEGLLNPPAVAGADVRTIDLQQTEAATKAGLDFSKMLGDVAHAFQLLGIGSDSVLGRFVGSLTVIGTGIDSIIKGNKQGGIAGALGMATGVIGVAAGAFSLLKGLFGGPSKEEKAAAAAEAKAAAARAEAERQRIADAARAMHTKGVEGLATVGPQFFMQRTITDSAQAERQGALFAAAWGTVVKEKGIVAAAAAFGEAFNKMKADIEAAGIDIPEWMKIISGQIELGMNDEFKALAEAAFTAAEFLKAFAEAGGSLTPDVLKSFEQEARAAFAGGKSVATGLGQSEADATKAGFAAANPLLRALLDESIVQGVTLSADIQAMIDAAGIVPSEMIQQLEELRAIRAAVQSMAGMGALPGGNGGVNPEDFTGLPEFSKGGRTPGSGDKGGGGGGSIVKVHANETIVPDENIPDFLKAHGGSGTIDSATASIIAEQVARKSRAPISISVQAPISLDASLVASASRAGVISEIRDEVSGRLFSPGSPEYRRLVKLVKRHSGS